MLQKLGNEFEILREIPMEDIEKAGDFRVAQGIKNLRDGKVMREPGFDGEYGKIRFLEDI